MQHFRVNSLQIKYVVKLSSPIIIGSANIIRIPLTTNNEVMWFPSFILHWFDSSLKITISPKTDQSVTEIHSTHTMYIRKTRLKSRLRHEIKVYYITTRAITAQ